MAKHIFSFFDNEQECIKSLLNIHNDGKDIDLDPMYNHGMFYKSLLNKPKYRFDLNAEQNGYDAENGDATNLPLENNSVHCMILDPPFMFEKRNREQKNVVQKQYTMFHNGFEELKECYLGIIKEAYRVLDKKGILIFKCQDYTDGKTTMTHCFVWQWAIENGFYAKDIAILNLPKTKIYNGNLRQKHLRKTHCYFWVFEKKTNRNRT